MKNFTLNKFHQIWQQLTNGSVNRKIFRAAIIVALGTVFVKVAAITKELVVAWKFGTNDELDAFLSALLVPSFIINVIAGSFHAALVPIYIQVREKEGKKAAQKLFSGVTIWGAVLLTITTVLMIVGAPLYLPWIAGGFDQQKLNLTFHQLCAIAPIILLNGIIVIWGAVLNAGERFALAAITPIITPTFTIFFLLGFESWQSYGLVTGLICGAALEIAILGIGLKRQGISLLPKWYGFDTSLRQFASQYAPTVAGAFLMCSSTIVDQSMAAMLSPGSVAALNYGNKFVALPINLTTTALSTAVIPYFSKMVAHKDWTGVNNTLKRCLALIFLITVPITVVLITFSQLIVQILFQRGSFTASDTLLVGQIQSYLALQIPFYTASILVVRLILSMQNNHILMWGSACNLIINVFGNYLFSKWLGVSGIALSTSCVYVFSFLFLFGYIKEKMKIKSNDVIL